MVVLFLTRDDWNRKIQSQSGMWMTEDQTEAPLVLLVILTGFTDFEDPKGKSLLDKKRTTKRCALLKHCLAQTNQLRNSERNTA